MLNRFDFKILLNLWFCFNFAMILAFNPSDVLKLLAEGKILDWKREVKCGYFHFHFHMILRDFSKTYQQLGVLE